MSPERAAIAALMRQSGSGSLPHFRSAIGYQRGRGLGSLLGSLVRRVIPLFRSPIVKKVGKSVGKAATTALLEAGQKALSAEQPMSFKDALKETSKAQAQTLIKHALKRPAAARPNGKAIKRHRAQTPRFSTRRDVFNK